MEDVVNMSGPMRQFYQGKRVLITGHRGFKGAWLGLWLKSLGCEVSGCGFPAPTTPSLHEIIGGHTFTRELDVDVVSLADLRSAVQSASPDLIFHLAAQPLVRKSYAEPLLTFQVNALGTATLLEAVRLNRCPASVVVVTTDKCYENVGKPGGYAETDPLGGHDIYSSSKAAAELAAQSWRRSFFQMDSDLGGVATARGGNVIGGGDYAEDRLVPDAIRALIAGKPIPVRNPAATRPWQHVLDCLSGYLWLGARLSQTGKTDPIHGAFNFGPNPNDNKPVQAVIEGILKSWPGSWKNLAAPGAPHEASKLNLSIQRAASLLGWRPVWDFNTALEKTVQWYHARHATQHENMIAVSLAQIEAYENSARKQGVAWAVRNES